jgi:hypothetical protein
MNIVTENKPINEPYKSSHWMGIPNPLAHLRMSDRDDGKTLHLEELQSDWGQEGRKKGFYDPNRPEEKSIMGQMARDVSQQVPSAPYVTDTNQWVDLGLKRALMEAAKGGYDKLIWTPGEQQAARYDLSKQIKDIAWNENNNVLIARDHSGNQIINKEVPKDQLSDHIGKEASEKLLASRHGDTPHHSLIGQELSIGGEGMKSFYDKLVPQRLSKLVAQYDKDAKVNLLGHEINTGRNKGPVSGDQIMNSLPQTQGMSESERSDWWRNLSQDKRDDLFDQFRSEKKMKAHSIEITPKLRAAILKGLPAFKSGGSVINNERSKNLDAYGPVRDKKGKPKVFYHGTSSDDFTMFSGEDVPYRGGLIAFVSEDPKFASQYAGASDEHMQNLDTLKSSSEHPVPDWAIRRNARVYPVHIKADNPFDYRKDYRKAAKFWDETGGFQDEYEHERLTGETDKLITKDDFVNLVKKGSWDALESPEFVEWLKNNEGHDAVIMKENGAINYGIFHPNQIKSATGNVGAYNPSDWDITKDHGGSVIDAAFKVLSKFSR